MGVRDRLGVTSPMTRAAIMMMAMGISLAIMVKFCILEPALTPRVFRKVNRISTMIAMILPIMPSMPNMATRARAPADREPGAVSRKLWKPARKPTRG